MKVTGPSGIGSPAQPGGGKRQAAVGFSVGAASSASALAAAASGLAGVVSLDTLLALQGVDSAAERRRRIVRRAGRILDVLDEVKLALLDHGVSSNQLDRLSAAVREERCLTDDPRLDRVLADIETRAAVEMAKLELARAA